VPSVSRAQEGRWVKADSSDRHSFPPSAEGSMRMRPGGCRMSIRRPGLRLVPSPLGWGSRFFSGAAFLDIVAGRPQNARRATWPSTDWSLSCRATTEAAAVALNSQATRSEYSLTEHLPIDLQPSPKVVVVGAWQTQNADSQVGARAARSTRSSTLRNTQTHPRRSARNRDLL
jgi:hypothetical protein